MKKQILLLLVLFGTFSSAQTKFNEPPKWAKEAVWYQIFPERFYNGDKSNDPKAIDMEGAWPFFVPKGWTITPWTHDWYKLQPYEKVRGKNFYEIVNIRRYGGDLQGVIDKLDYLKKLGITAIYLNPIFESPSLHKYDATMYHHVDNNFGPDPEGDRKMWGEEDPSNPKTWKWTSADKLLLKLIKETHKRGMKIMLDGVFNHMGQTSWAFLDIKKNQQNSKFKDWFTIKKWDDPTTKENEFDWQGWVGIKDLPEVREDENGIVAGPKEYIFNSVKRWMDPNGDGNVEDGIDGWRLDVAEMVSHKFWKEFRTFVRGINPETYIVGEVWWEDWNKYKMFDARPWVAGDEFDAVMNYRYMRANKNFVLNKKEQDDSQAYQDSLTTMMKSFGDSYYAMLNLLGSHDTERLASVVINPDYKYDHQANVRDSKEYDIRKPSATERLKQKLMVALQFTQPGSVHIYNGDEAGMWGGDDPDERKPNVWQEFKYEPETTHPFNKPRPVDEVKFDNDLFKFYQKMASLRNSNKILSLGTISFNVIDNNLKIIGYTRELNNEKVYVIANNNSESNTLNLAADDFLGSKAGYKDLVSGVSIKMERNQYNIKLAPYQLVVLK
ncbi:MAG: alpha-amylase [Stygiobacter sp. RIFOXYC12_FULL_38_8]|nr:MAG: alpha-amylase [Stygiobacter sp. RIFOXYB2_FULL_37_11]OGV13252.1 MAG: alpha-amylase [Stygiobacter sp. RIFOXYC2_FULL_38_25]OGV25751.1 MAG: alpha-amylase [Stygiobacter sp. RIFOXYC12_FULL_38_8]OGV83298.1 MAG: alpha-amylase [Stygiobacter sp. GWF2_38_21]